MGGCEEQSAEQVAKVWRRVRRDDMHPADARPPWEILDLSSPKVCEYLVPGTRTVEGCETKSELYNSFYRKRVLEYCSTRVRGQKSTVTEGHYRVAASCLLRRAKKAL